MMTVMMMMMMMMAGKLFSANNLSDLRIQSAVMTFDFLRVTDKDLCRTLCGGGVLCMC